MLKEAKGVKIGRELEQGGASSRPLFPPLVMFRLGLIGFMLTLMLVLLPLSGCRLQLFNSPPTAAIEASPGGGEAPLTVSFDISASSDPDGKIVWFELYFGDCTLPLTGTGADIGRPIRHTYRRAGTFKAVLTVKDDSGATAEATVTIAVEGPPPIETLTVGGGTVKVGDALEVPITLDRAPQGLAGYIMTVWLVTGKVAEIEKVTLVTPRGAGTVRIASDKKSATFQAVDFGHEIGPGHSEITLARVSFKGLKKGASTICAQLERLDADGGADLLPVTEIEPGELTVTR